MTMTAAGGTNVGGGVVSLPGLHISNRSIQGGLAAVQDIGALPSKLDGISGLSLLAQYSHVDFDFSERLLRLHEGETPSLPRGWSSSNPVADAFLKRTSIGVFFVEVILDGRGHVNMLVDTGAASTLLNWEGLASLGLSESSDQVLKNPYNSMGAMGADNVALSLNHAILVQRRWNLVQPAINSYSPGIKLKKSFKIDVGSIPILDSLKGDIVGGILGSDLLMMCGLVQFFNISGQKPKLVLYDKN